MYGLIKSIQSELGNWKPTPGSILLGSLSLIGFLTVFKYQLGLLNILFCFSPLSKPFKISLDQLKVNLVEKRRAIEDSKVPPSDRPPKNSASWAVITGPTNGIGKEFALQLARRGFNLLLIGRNQEKLDALKAQLEQAHTSIDIQLAAIDLAQTHPVFHPDEKTALAPVEHQTKSPEWKNILETLTRISAHSNISVLVNNAGLSHSQPTQFELNALDKDIDSIINVNVLSVLYLTKLVLPFMLKFNKGLILNVGSFSALVPTPLLSTYAGSKGFLYTWSQALGTELEPKGIHVGLLNTYFVASEMSKIRKTSFLIPSPKTYVSQVLNNLTSTNLKPHIITGYFSHSLLEFFLDHFGSLKFWLRFNLNMQLAIQKRINKKKSRAQVSKD